MEQALSGIKVIELSDFISGPYCGKLFAGLGARVIKIEKPGLGDKARSWGPFPDDIPHAEKSGLFLFLNMDKQGITLNIETALGMKIFKELLKGVDILVEDNQPEEAKRLGLDYDSLHKLNPRLIVTSITPFGQTGPFRDYKGSDLLDTHTSGEAFANPSGGVSDIEKYPPLKVPAHEGEFMCGLTAAVCAMSAVMVQQASSLGQHVDVSKQEAVTNTQRTNLATYIAELPTNGRQKRAGGGGAQLYKTRDGWACLFSGPHYDDIVKMMGSPVWSKEDIFRDPAKRAQHGAELSEKFNDWTKQHDGEEISRLALANRVPGSHSRSIGDFVNDGQLEAREFFVELGHPEAGTFKYPGAPYKLSGTPWQAKSPAPLLGQHNEEIYCQILGYSREDLVRMRQAGIV